MHCLIQYADQVDGFVWSILLTADFQESPQGSLRQVELTQCYLQCFAITMCTFAGMELNREPGAGDGVAKLVRHAARDLCKEAMPFAELYCFLQSGQTLGHLVDGDGKIAKFIIKARERHRAEIAPRDETSPALQGLNPADQSTAENQH